jgi:hypothetical protein
MPQFIPGSAFFKTYSVAPENSLCQNFSFPLGLARYGIFGRTFHHPWKISKVAPASHSAAFSTMSARIRQTCFFFHCFTEMKAKMALGKESRKSAI